MISSVRVSSVSMKEKKIITKPDSFDIGENDIHIPNIFQSMSRHTDYSAQDLNERWFISVAQDAKILKNTAQRFLRSSLLPLARRYQADRMFERKLFAGIGL